MPTPLIAEVSAMTPILIGSAAWVGGAASASPKAALTTPIVCDNRMISCPFTERQTSLSAQNDGKWVNARSCSATQAVWQGFDQVLKKELGCS
jgi:hypothetical protein